MENKGTSKHSIIGFILIGLVFFGYMLYNNYQMKKYNEQMALEQAANVVATEASAAVAAEQAVAEATTEQTQAPVVVEDAFIIDSAEQTEKVVENDYLTLTFSSVGGQIVDATLKEHTKYAPKEERNELVKLFDPQSARFDLSFYVKDGLKNIKVSTIEHNFTLMPVETLEDKQLLTFRLPFKGGESLDFVYTIYNPQEYL